LKMLLFLTLLFLVSCTKHTTYSNVQQVDEEVHDPELDTCVLTSKTYTNVMSPDNPNWIGQLIIASPLTIGTNPSVGQIGFYVQSASYTGTSYVDLLIYDSLSNGNPGNLLYKVPNVDIGQFMINQVGCVPFMANFAIGKKLFVGFWTQGATPTKVIARQNAPGAQYYFNIQNLGSPNVGSPFPQYQIWNEQIMMGFSSSNPCANLTCGSCTLNSACVWCINSQSCISSASIPQCPSWTRNPGYCHVCAQFTSCLDCASPTYNCTWCMTNGQPSTCLRTAADGNCTTAITNPNFCNLF